MLSGERVGDWINMRLKVDARMRRLVRLVPVVNVYSLVELVLLALLAIQVARFVWVLVTPVAPLGDWRPAGPQLPALPGETIAGFDPFFRLGQQAGPQVVTSLQLTLFGTRQNEATGGGSAIIAGPDGVQNSYAVGDEIQPGVKLVAVAFDHVTVSRGAAQEDLFLDQSGPATPVTPAGGTTPAPLGTALPGAAPAGVTAASIRNDIGFIPRLDGGRVSGLVVRPVGAGAAFRAAGLREGDVVTSIGGRPLNGPGDLDRVTADFKAGGNIPLTVERGRETLSLSLTVAPGQ